MTDLPRHVTIREVALRDGLQIEEPIGLPAKRELLAAIAATGVREVEATAFVSPTKVPALADAAELAADLADFPTSSSPRWWPARTAPNGRSRRACTPSSTWSRPPTGTAAPTSGAPAARRRPPIADIVAIAHDSDATVEVIVATAWDCPFDGPTPPQRVLDIVDTACEVGADRLAIADTIGTTTPGRVTALLGRVRPRIGDKPLGAHFHNTRGTGLASAYAAVAAGITRLDASVGGLGGCPFAPGARAATSPPRTWCTCCATAASPSTSTCRRRSRPPGWPRPPSATTCRVRCCGPATASGTEPWRPHRHTS